MGRIFERFGNIHFHNEAEVSNRFVDLLFTEFLDYKENEILPEHLLPVVKIPRNREKLVDGNDAKIKPDFIIALDGDVQQVVFSLDSKGPNESLDNHLQQLLAYCISVGVNLVAATNGREFRVYNANDLVFRAVDIVSLDLQFPELRKLLHKEVAHISVTERIRSLDDDKALGRSIDIIGNEKRRHIAVRNSDFVPYLYTVTNSPDELTLPPVISEAFQIQFKRFPAQRLYTFLPFRADFDLKPSEPRTYNHIVREIRNSSILIVGESGIGKTSLLTQIARERAEACLHHDSDLIPVLVRLGHYTSTNNLRLLISNRLNGGGISVSEQEVIKLLRQGRLILLLDAFDEVIDTYLHDLQQEIENILHNFSCSVVITTRHFRLPQLSLSTKYEMLPLTWQKIRAFSELYLGADYLNFLNEVALKSLSRIVSNTLLLTLLILLYLNNQALPHSRTQVIAEVVRQLEKWSQSKTQRFQGSLSWQIKLNILSQLAFLSFVKGDLYVLDAKEANGTLTRILDELEARRIVPRGMLISDAYTQLVDIGLINLQNGNISFWHRAFQEYLASLQIMEQIQSEQIQISDVIRIPKWEAVLPCVAYQTKNPNILISNLLSYNIFVAGRAIIECDQRSGEVYEKTVECLKQRCESKQKSIRQLAINLLRQIEGDYVGEKFRELLESEQLKANCECEHIRKIALIEIARRKIPGARDIVYAHLDWYSYTRLDWINQEVHAGATVIEALSWFDDEESQQHIVNHWIRNKDFPTQDACRDALIRIANRSGLSSTIKYTLLELLTNEHSQKNLPPDIVSANNEVDYWGIEEVLIAIHDVSLALQLIPVLATTEDRALQDHCIQILKTFDEPEIIDVLVQQIDLHRNNPFLCTHFLDVLSEIEGEIPLEIFWKFAQDRLPTTVKAYAIRGLGKFSFDKIKDIVLAAIHPPSYEELVEIAHTHLIEQVLQIHHDTEIIQMITNFASLPDLPDNARLYLQELVAKANNASELLRQIAKIDISDDVQWNIIINHQRLSSETLQRTVLGLVSPLPYDLLLNDWPCDYACVQDEVFHILEKHGQIVLLAKAENQPEFLFNISLETLFNAIRRDKIDEMESFISSFIEKRIDVHQVNVRQGVVEAAWVLADLGNIKKAQQVIDQIIKSIDLSRSGNDGILGDILKGIHLLPSDYALAQIEKIWLNIEASNSVLVPTDCIEALERIGTQQALDMLARIAQEASKQQDSRLETERALRAIQKVSPVGREDWLIRFLQQNHKDTYVIQRVIDMLGTTGHLQALPMIRQYFENHPSEKIRYVAFWAIHNIYKQAKEVWYDGEEVGCL